MNRPIRLEIHEHCYNDGWNKHTVVRAIFTHEQAEIPSGWKKATRFEYVHEDEIAYLKTMPYGTMVLNGRIVF